MQELFTDKPGDTDTLFVGNEFDRAGIAEAIIYPFSSEVIVFEKDGHYYYFEKVQKE